MATPISSKAQKILDGHNNKVNFKANIQWYKKWRKGKKDIKIED